MYRLIVVAVVFALHAIPAKGWAYDKIPALPIPENMGVDFFIDDWHPAQQADLHMGIMTIGEDAITYENGSTRHNYRVIAHNDYFVLLFADFWEFGENQNKFYFFQLSWIDTKHNRKLRIRSCPVRKSLNLTMADFERPREEIWQLFQKGSGCGTDGFEPSDEGEFSFDDKGSLYSRLRPRSYDRKW